ncbi:MAG TPA: ribosomal protein L7/L12 [Pyrinomonadaceae bacterium]|jgi:streptogramin lyase
MTQPFKCPSCGGPLEYDGFNTTVRCSFCSNQVIVPEELLGGSAHARGSAAAPLPEQLGRLAEIGRLISGGNKIAAIKVYRETFGVGLTEAKEAVENLSAGRSVEVSRGVRINGLQYQSPPLPYSAPPQAYRARTSKGCSPLVIAIVILTVIVSAVVGIALLGLTARHNRTSAPGDPASTNKSNARPAKQAGGGNMSGFARVVQVFGSDGIGAGQFKDARSVAVDGDGHIYAADYTGGRVQVFDASGKFLTQWMVDAKMPLLSLAADRKGTVYVVQSGDINRYEGMTGKSLGKVPSTGRGFDDVAVAADGGLVAVQNGQDIVRFDASGRTISVIKDAITEQSGDSELDGRIAVDGLGNVYELGTFNNAVFKFAPNGKYINRIGGVGEEAGLFRAPNSVAVDGQGRIYVSDIKGIQVFDSNGRYLDVFKVEKNVPFGMVFNDRNELFVAARTEIVKFALNK